MSFLTKRPSRGVTVAGAVVLAAGILIGYAGGGIAGSGIPANKAAASGRKAVVAAPGSKVEILKATVHTSKPTDLIFQVAAECAIVTKHTRDGKTTYNEAAGSVLVWVEVDGKIVPITSSSAPPQNPPAWGDDSDKATFCERHEYFKKTDGNPACSEGTTPDPVTGDPTTVVTGCEFEEWYQKVKTANAFNWLRLNLGSGNHDIVVRADLTATTTPTQDTATVGETSTAEAVIGNRTLIIEPTKLANDAQIN